MLLTAVWPSIPHRCCPHSYWTASARLRTPRASHQHCHHGSESDVSAVGDILYQRTHHMIDSDSLMLVLRNNLSRLRTFIASMLEYWPRIPKPSPSRHCLQFEDLELCSKHKHGSSAEPSLAACTTTYRVDRTSQDLLPCFHDCVPSTLRN
jgi:hypothetical protein